jgi:hypothetical protein
VRDERRRVAWWAFIAAEYGRLMCGVLHLSMTNNEKP